MTGDYQNQAAQAMCGQAAHQHYWTAATQIQAASATAQQQFRFAELGHTHGQSLWAGLPTTGTPVPTTTAPLGGIGGGGLPLGIPVMVPPQGDPGVIDRLWKAIEEEKARQEATAKRLQEALTELAQLHTLVASLLAMKAPEPKAEHPAPRMLRQWEGIGGHYGQVDGR